MKVHKSITHLSYVIPLICSAAFFLKLDQYSLWYDELQTLSTVSQSSISLFFKDYFIKQAGPPLYYFLLWTMNNFLSWNEFSLRIFSAICMLGVNMTVFHFLKKNVNLVMGSLACFLVSTNYFSIYYSHEARPYALLMFFACLSINIFCDIFKNIEIQKKLKQLYLVNFALLLTHYYASFLIIAEIILIVLFTKLERNKKIKAVAVGLLSLTPSVLIFFSREIRLSFNFLEQTQLTSFNTYFESFGDNRVALVVAITLIITLITNLIKKTKKNEVLLAGLLIGTLSLTYLQIYIFSKFLPIFIMRYQVFLLPLHFALFLILIKLALEEILIVVKSTFFSKSITNTFLIFIILFLSYAQHFETYSAAEYNLIGNRYPYKEALQAIYKDSSQTIKKVILDDASEEAFRFYEKSITPIFFNFIGLSAKEKNEYINLILNSELSEEYYFFKVQYKNADQIVDYLENKDFKKKLIFSSSEISVLKFTHK